MIKVDMTGNEQVLTKDLSRAQRKNIPVNLVYPADYPARPAILLEELFGPKQALQALDRIDSPEESTNTEAKRTASVAAKKAS